ncbi:MAG: type II secretion system protein [Gammaproteobacteria bacterium]|nr:MAG: type II secretion system protein [Gammaproteobacteria bacterium]
MKKQTGFTLIELVLVITILGILAAFAVPRFINITGDARLATVNALAGSMRSAAALAHSMALATAAGAASSISMEGATVTMAFHYPTGDAAGIGTALQDTGGFFSNASGSTITFSPGAAIDSDCQVTYTSSTGTGLSPTITVTASAANCA